MALCNPFLSTQIFLSIYLDTLQEADMSSGMDQQLIPHTEHFLNNLLQPIIKTLQSYHQKDGYHHSQQLLKDLRKYLDFLRILSVQKPGQNGINCYSYHGLINHTPIWIQNQHYLNMIFHKYPVRRDTYCLKQ